MNLKEIKKIFLGRIRLPLIEAHKQGIKIEKISTKPNCYQLKKGDKIKYIFESLDFTPYFPINDNAAFRISKNKEVTKKILDKNKIKVPKSVSVKNFSELKESLKKKVIKYPLVIKPLSGTCGVGIMANLQTDAESKKAISNIKSNSKFNINKKLIIAEEFYKGKDYRLLVIDGKIVAAIERILPRVTGDGKSTIKELVLKLIRRHHAYLNIDEEIKKNVKRSKHSLTDVLPAEEEIIIRYNANTSTGGLAKNITANISPYFKDVAKKAMQAMNLRYGGVDLLTKDISKKGDYRILEINGNADHTGGHIKPDIGKAVDASSQIVKAIFKK